MIIRVQFTTVEQPINMMFGDSYKSWKEQYLEYLRDAERLTQGLARPIAEWKSNARWIGWGYILGI